MTGRQSFTREELYNLVWSEPMIRLGARFGISANGLKKACRRAHIPVPPPGYWNKLQAGHKVTKALLPPASGGTPAKVTINPPSQRPAPPPPPPVPASVQEKIQAERQLGKSVTVLKTLSSPHRIVDGWVQDSRREQRVTRYDAWSRSLYTPIDKTETDKRRMRILNALFKTLEERGYKLNAGESYHRLVQIGLEHEKLEITLEERIRQARRYLSDEEKARYGYSVASQKWTQEKIATGELILKIKEPDLHGSDKEWRETAEAPLEDKLSDIVAEIAGLFEAIRLRRVREAEERERRWKLEEQRRLAEMERKRETIRYRRLIGNCEDWRTAADIRAFVAAIEASPLGGRNTEAFAGWKLWALAHADRIDPLQDEDLFDLKVGDHEVYSLRE
jgi:hypothetical protein